MERTDLTKLTAKELMRRVIFEDDSDAVNEETALRLERLEKCEVALRKLALDLGPLGKIARAALEGK